MKKSSLLLLITLFLVVCFFFVPKTTYADAIPAITWGVNSSLDLSTYNPGDVITISGTISSTLCSNSIGPINVGYTNYNDSCAARQCGAYMQQPPTDNPGLLAIYQRLNAMWNDLGLNASLSNCMNTKCPPQDITPANPNNVMTLVGGGSTLEWQNKVLIPPNTPCGVYSFKLNWSQPIYSKGTGSLVATATGSKVITVQIGQTGICGPAYNVASASSPSTSSLCSSGRASNVFSIGNSWKWTCDTFLDLCGDPTPCTAPKIAVAGACGTNAQPNPRTYSAGSSTFFGTFCLNGVTPVPSNPSFPTADSPTTEWFCGSTSCKAILSTSGSCL